MKNLLLIALLCIGTYADAQLTLNNVTLAAKLKTDKSELSSEWWRNSKKGIF
jgi:hypothetical protein